MGLHIYTLDLAKPSLSLTMCDGFVFAARISIALSVCLHVYSLVKRFGGRRLCLSRLSHTLCAGKRIENWKKFALNFFYNKNIFYCIIFCYIVKSILSTKHCFFLFVASIYDLTTHPHSLTRAVFKSETNCIILEIAGLSWAEREKTKRNLPCVCDLSWRVGNQDWDLIALSRCVYVYVAHKVCVCTLAIREKKISIFFYLKSKKKNLSVLVYCLYKIVFKIVCDRSKGYK